MFWQSDLAPTLVLALLVALMCWAWDWFTDMLDPPGRPPRKS